MLLDVWNIAFLNGVLLRIWTKIHWQFLTEGFLMAENLNEYFSLVFTREDISTLPVLETKFEGRECDYLGQLTVTPKW